MFFKLTLIFVLFIFIFSFLNEIKAQYYGAVPVICILYTSYKKPIKSSLVAVGGWVQNERTFCSLMKLGKIFVSSLRPPTLVLHSEQGQNYYYLN